MLSPHTPLTAESDSISGCWVFGTLYLFRNVDEMVSLAGQHDFLVVRSSYGFILDVLVLEAGCLLRLSFHKPMGV